MCKNKTRLKLRVDTELKNFPLFCSKCKRETLVEAKNLQITVIKEQTHKHRADELVKKLTDHRLYNLKKLKKGEGFLNFIRLPL